MNYCEISLDLNWSEIIDSESNSEFLNSYVRDNYDHVRDVYENYLCKTFNVQNTEIFKLVNPDSSDNDQILDVHGFVTTDKCGVLSQTYEDYQELNPNLEIAKTLYKSSLSKFGYEIQEYLRKDQNNQLFSGFSHTAISDRLQPNMVATSTTFNGKFINEEQELNAHELYSQLKTRLQNMFSGSDREKIQVNFSYTCDDGNGNINNDIIDINLAN